MRINLVRDILKQKQQLSPKELQVAAFLSYLTEPMGQSSILLHCGIDAKSSKPFSGAVAKWTKAADCKSAIPGSNPGGASSFLLFAAANSAFVARLSTAALLCAGSFCAAAFVQAIGHR